MQYSVEPPGDKQDKKAVLATDQNQIHTDKHPDK
jgi:hypothetical protein